MKELGKKSLNGNIAYCEYCDIKSGFRVCSDRCNQVAPDLLNRLIELNQTAIKENWKMSEVGEQFFKIFAYNHVK